MRHLLFAAVAACTSCTAPAPHTLQSPTVVKVADCVGAEVVRWVDEPVGCNLTPPQLLTLLGSTEVDCADMGGSWAYEACVGVDY